MSARLLASTWTLPALIGALSLFGLVAALTGDGWRDAVAWLALAVPVAVVARAALSSSVISTRKTR